MLARFARPKYSPEFKVRTYIEQLLLTAANNSGSPLKEDPAAIS